MSKYPSIIHRIPVTGPAPPPSLKQIHGHYTSIICMTMFKYHCAFTGTCLVNEIFCILGFLYLYSSHSEKLENRFTLLMELECLMSDSCETRRTVTNTSIKNRELLILHGSMSTGLGSSLDTLCVNVVKSLFKASLKSAN